MLGFLAVSWLTRPCVLGKCSSAELDPGQMHLRIGELEISLYPPQTRRLRLRVQERDFL